MKIIIYFISKETDGTKIKDQSGNVVKKLEKKEIIGVDEQKFSRSSWSVYLIKNNLLENVLRLLWKKKNL